MWLASRLHQIYHNESFSVYKIHKIRNWGFFEAVNCIIYIRMSHSMHIAHSRQMLKLGSFLFRGILNGIAKANVKTRILIFELRCQKPRPISIYLLQLVSKCFRIQHSKSNYSPVRRSIQHATFHAQNNRMFSQA